MCLPVSVIEDTNFLWHAIYTRRIVAVVIHRCSWIRVPLIGVVIYVQIIVYVQRRYTPRHSVLHELRYTVPYVCFIEQSKYHGWCNPWQDSRVNSDIQHHVQLPEPRVLVGGNFTTKRLEQTQWPLHVLSNHKKKKKCDSAVVYIYLFVFE